VIDLRKWLLVIGIIVFSSGLAATMSSKISFKTYGSQLEVGRISDFSVNITRFFNEEEKISVSVLPRASWMFGPLEPPTQPIPVNHVGVLLRIYDPQGKNTTITIPFVRMEQRMAIFMEFIWVMRHDGISWENGKNYGIVRLRGNYTVQVFGVYPAGKEPPAQLIVYRNKPIFEHPYHFLFPIGISTSVVGLTISVWSLSAKSKKRVPLKRKMKRIKREGTSREFNFN